MTTTDYTSEIAELNAAYQANRVANASIAVEVKSKYRAIIASEIAQRKQEADLTFAHHLALVKSRSGMPVGVIQDHVLHTKSWDRWTYWRDLAGISLERVSVTDAKKARELDESAFIWADDFSTLTVKRNSLGHSIEPVIYDMSTNRKADNLWWPTVTNDEDNLVRVIKTDAPYAFAKMVSAEIQRQVDAGNAKGD